MSKNHRQDNRKPGVADWIVNNIQCKPALITSARMRRDEHGGYTFTDDRGTVADFPPGTVLNVLRQEGERELVSLLPEQIADLEALDSRA